MTYLFLEASQLKLFISNRFSDKFKIVLVYFEFYVGVKFSPVLKVVMLNVRLCILLLTVFTSIKNVEIDFRLGKIVETALSLIDLIGPRFNTAKRKVISSNKYLFDCF